MKQANLLCAMIVFVATVSLHGGDYELQQLVGACNSLHPLSVEILLNPYIKERNRTGFITKNFNKLIVDDKGKNHGTMLHCVVNQVQKIIESNELNVFKNALEHNGKRIIKLLQKVGCNPLIRNNEGKIVLDLLEEGVFRSELQSILKWQKSIEELPEYMRKKLRYIPPTLKENKKTVFVVLHGSDTDLKGRDNSGPRNDHYHDPSSEGFQGFLELAQSYADLHGKKIDLLSFEWTGILSDNAREIAAKNLVRYLDSEYPECQVGIIAHSHGCNVVNIASSLVNHLKTEQNENGIYKGRLGPVIFLAVPCRQEFEGSGPYNQINNRNTLKLTNYDHLFVFQSRSDPIAGLGAVDIYSWLGMVAPLLAGTVAKELIVGVVTGGPGGLVPRIGTNLIWQGGTLLSSFALDAILDNNPNIDETLKKRLKFVVGPILDGLVNQGSFIPGLKEVSVSGLKELTIGSINKATITKLLYYRLLNQSIEAYKKKLDYSHKYKDLKPINQKKEIIKPESKEKVVTYTIEGPKAHVEVMVNGQYIGHSNVTLLKNLGKIYTFLNVNFPLSVWCCGDFTVEIWTGDFLDSLEKTHERYFLNPNRLESPISQREDEFYCYLNEEIFKNEFVGNKNLYSRYMWEIVINKDNKDCYHKFNPLKENIKYTDSNILDHEWENISQMQKALTDSIHELCKRAQKELQKSIEHDLDVNEEQLMEYEELVKGEQNTRKENNSCTLL